MKVFFATDIHGSEICWRKFLNAAAFYKADMVILGGDVTGKVLVPIPAMPGYWEVSFGGQRMRLETKTELDEIQRKIRNRGSYPAGDGPRRTRRAERGGRRGRPPVHHGDDPRPGPAGWTWPTASCAAATSRASSTAGTTTSGRSTTSSSRRPASASARARLLDIGGFYLVSMGWTNPTPWNTFREAPEEELATKIDAVVAPDPGHGAGDLQLPRPALRHRPGRGARPGRDMRPTHGGAVMKPVGSKAVRDAILKLPADAFRARAHPREPGHQARWAGPWP